VPTSKIIANFISDTMFAALADESSPPSPIQTPPRAKDPPEAALPSVQAGLTHAHEDHLPTAPPTPTTTMMPLPPPLEDAPLTQEWSTSHPDNSKKKRSRLAYVNKGILATRELFLNSDEDISVCEDPTYLVGKVLSAPRKGVTDEFSLYWDRSALPPSFANVKLRETVHKDDVKKVGQLRIARHQFDADYPDGSLPPALMTVEMRKIPKNKQSTSRSNGHLSSKKTNASTNINIAAADSTPQRRSRLITELRMTPAVRIDNQFDTPTPDDEVGTSIKQHKGNISTGIQFANITSIVC
jgi:hypothetical protein